MPPCSAERANCPCACHTANAEVTRFKVLERTASALQGRGFGAAGQVEKISASATIALDPANPRNAVIADLDRAPRNADGKVEAISDVVILRPAYPNGILLFEIPNRGRRLISAWFDNSSIQGSVRLDQADDAGRGFLLSQGYTLVWAGWQADAPAGAGLLNIQVPVVAGITGPVRQEWSFGDTTNPHRATLSYPVADRASAQLSVRARADDLRQNPPELKFSFIDDMMIEIGRPSGLIPDALYEMTYTARDPKVTGMGLAAIRDVTAFLRREGGPANPLAADGQSGISRAIGLGISQSGRVLRDVLYYGMNEDEAGRLVFEAMMPIIPGARRSFTNDRFAEPGRNPGPEFDRLYPVLRFPFTYAVTEDVFTGRRDGLLLRCSLTNTCPRIMHVDSEFEFWGSEASLLVTDTRGRNLEPPPEVRLYMVAGSPHGNVANAVVTRRASCTLPLNPVYGGPAFRALLTDLRAWITEGVPPPASRYPTLAQNTLVAAGDVYPVPIPGLGYRVQYARAEAIEQDTPLPKIRGEYPLYLPRAGARMAMRWPASACRCLLPLERPIRDGIRSPGQTADKRCVPRWAPRSHSRERAQNVSRRQIRAHRSRSSIPRRMPMWRRSRLRRHGWWMSACCSPRMPQKRLPPRKPAHLPGLTRSQGAGKRGCRLASN